MEKIMYNYYLCITLGNWENQRYKRTPKFTKDRPGVFILLILNALSLLHKWCNNMAYCIEVIEGWVETRDQTQAKMNNVTKK